jgi:hypothetical protein
VLHLGNITLDVQESLFSPKKGGEEGVRGGRRAAEFSGDDMAKISREGDVALKFASRLLKCDAESLRQALCVRCVSVCVHVCTCAYIQA